MNRLISEAEFDSSLVAEKGEIYESDFLQIIDEKQENNKMLINFEIPFIICINKKYNVTAVAIGSLYIPALDCFEYENPDLLSTWE